MGDLLICDHQLHEQRESRLFEEVPRIQREAADLTKAPTSKERATWKDLRELGSCKPDGWSELWAESFLWQQMKVVLATVAGSCLCAGVPKYRREHREHESKRRKAGVLGRGTAKQGTCQLLCWVCMSSIARVEGCRRERRWQSEAAQGTTATLVRSAQRKSHFG